MAATTKSRKCFLDLLRIIACFLVIVNHTNSSIFLSATPQNLSWFVSLSYFFVSKIAVPIFFMISGYLMLNRCDSWKKTLDRLFRIAIVLLACSFIYATYRALNTGGDISVLHIVKEALTVYRKSPSNALWYLYAYLGILVMLPFLQKMAAAMSRTDYHIFFAVSGLYYSVLPILSHYFPKVIIYGEFRLPIFGAYIAMLLIGGYFSRFEIKKSRAGFFIAAMLFLIMLAFNVTATFFEYQKSSSSYLFFDNRAFLPIVLQSVCVFYVFSFVKLPEKTSRAISFIGAHTFGIYLISDMTIDLLNPLYIKACAHMHPLIAVFLFEVCVFLIGFAVIALLKKLPVIKKVL